MGTNQKSISIRWVYLVVGVIAMLFAGIIYAWSILKAPLATEFGWTTSNLALNYTLTMCCFCGGGIIGSQLSKRIGGRVAVIIAAVLAGGGFLLTSRLNGGSVGVLYITYAVMAGVGIGIAYNVIISTVSAWFPDKKGTCSGALMMGFGASALILGNLASSFIENPAMGWRTTFVILGIALLVVLIIASLIIRKPAADVVLPQPKPARGSSKEDFEAKDYTTGQMVRRSTFWRCLVFIVCLAAVGSTVISFAKDLSLAVGASAALATTLVGVLSVCNGLGRILMGALFDVIGRRKTMMLANIVTIIATVVALVAVLAHSVPLCVLGLCLTGISYGACPTLSSALISAFYGTKYFPLNFSVMNFNLVGGSFMATAASVLLTSSGGYVAPFVLLLVLAFVALVLNFSIKRP